jgi:hypothetical protein
MYRAQGFEPFDDASALLGVLTDEPTVHWSRAELQLQFGWQPERLEDALAELQREGLAHYQSGFAFASRAAASARLMLA